MNTFPTLIRHPRYRAFDVCYHTLDGDIPRKQLEFMIEWLSKQCQKNFIMTSVGSAIVAGGWTNNLSAWERGEFKVDKQKFRPVVDHYELRLYAEDQVPFELTWGDKILDEEA